MQQKIQQQYAMDYEGRTGQDGVFDLKVLGGGAGAGVGGVGIAATEMSDSVGVVPAGFFSSVGVGRGPGGNGGSGGAAKITKIHLRLELILVFQRFTKEEVSNISRIIHNKQSNVTNNLTVL